MPTLTVQLAAGSVGEARGTGGSYPPSFSSSSTGLPSTTRRSTGFNLAVALLRFDTSALPDDAVVESATLTLIAERVANGDGRSVTADWFDFGGTVDSGDYTATAGVTAHTGTALSQFPEKAQTQTFTPAGSSGSVFFMSLAVISTPLALLAAAANVSKSGFTGLRLHISGGQPSLTNELRILAAALTVNYAGAGQSGGSSPPPSGQSGQPATPPGVPAPPAPFIQPTASRRKPRLAIPWRLELADLSGRPIALISRITLNKALSYRLNGPATLTFRVPSDDKRVRELHTDGLPRLHPQARVVKAYRQEQDAGGASRWVLRFSGRVWQVEHVGGPDDAWTEVVCFDPWQLLGRRIIAAESFEDVDGAVIARQLVDAANTVASTGVTTDGGTFEQAPARTRPYSQQSVGSALVELATAFNGFDIFLQPYQPADSLGNPVYDGTLCRMHTFTKLGRWQPELKLSWGAPPHNATNVKRLLDGETMANSIVALGQSSIAGPVQDAPSQALYGLLEAVASYTDITSPEFLDALLAEHLAFRRRPRELVEITPQPGRAPEPFTHINIGDSFEVFAGERLCGGFAGLQRCYGFDISLADETATETVTKFMTTPAGA